MLTAVVDGLGSHLLADMVDRLLVGRRWHRWTHHCHRGGESDLRRGLWPHCLGGCMLLLRWRWGSTGSQREDCLVEAHHQATQRVHPCCSMIVIRSRPAARVAVVGDSNVPTKLGTMVPDLVALVWHRGAIRVLSCHYQRVVRRHLMSAAAPAAGRLSMM